MGDGTVHLAKDARRPGYADPAGSFCHLRIGVRVDPRFGVGQLLLSDVVEQVLQGNLRPLLDGVGHGNDGFALAESLISKLFHEIQRRMGTAI